MGRRLASATIAAAVLVACAPPDRHARPDHKAATRAPRFVEHVDPAAPMGAVTTSFREGRPYAIRALEVATSTEESPEEAAADYVARFASAWGGLPYAHVAERTVRLPSGLVVVVLRGTAHGLPIASDVLRVTMTRDHALLAIAGAPEHAPVSDDAAFRVPEAAAHEAASRAALGEGARPSMLVSSRALVPREGALVPVHRVSIFGAREGVAGEGSRVDVDARRGEVLGVVSLTARDAYAYRVFADALPPHRPYEGPQTSTMPHPLGAPNGVQPAFVAPQLVTVEGLITSLPMPDPWLPSGATTTTGNNVDAYGDLYAPDGFTAGLDHRTIAVGGVFGATYDPGLDALAATTQQDAAITQLFFTINWLHDYYYDSGFTELAWNAQTDVYGRGGLGGDAMLAEAQDAAIDGARDNANMTTFEDGIPPRMQVYLWRGDDTRSLDVEGVGVLANATAAFGARSFDVTGELVVSDDGAGASATDACEPLVGDVEGRVVLVDRGTCLFVEKAANVQAAGGLAMVVVNNVEGNDVINMSGSDPAVTIPCTGIGRDDGARVTAALAEGPITAHLVRVVAPERDASLDGTIVAHEWGHYLHHRLSDCDGTKQCRAMSEGWADFVALHMGLREGDALDGAYPIAVYADSVGSPDPAYFGLRRQPYSTDRTRNALSFRHIARGEPLPSHPQVPTVDDNAQVHNAGEIWASALFDALVALVRVHGVEPGRRRMADYVVAGLAGTPRDATFTETRDALLLAAGAFDADDAEAMAEAFAARGMGACAVSPARTSDDLIGVIESAEPGARVVVQSVALVDDVASCDDDGVLDAGERGHVELTIANVGTVAAMGTLTLSSPATGLVFERAEAQVDGLLPLTRTLVRLPVALSGTLDGAGVTELTAHVTGDGLCAGATTTVRLRTNVDDVPASATVETFESTSLGFVATGTPVFRRVVDAVTLDGAFEADYVPRADGQLVSVPVVVGDAPFRVFFAHRYVFESASIPGFGVDGAVVEVSLDDGATWEDVIAHGALAYPGAILDTDGAAAPLRGRSAFVGRSAGYPLEAQSMIDFGTALAGQTIRLRFRFAANDTVPGAPWRIDDVRFVGIVGTPFGAVVPDRAACLAPVDGGVEEAGIHVDAGEDAGATGGASGGAACALVHARARAAWMHGIGALALCLLRRRRRAGAVRAR